MNNYESRRARRLRIEREQRQKRHRSMRNLGLAAVVIILAIAGAALWLTIEKSAKDRQLKQSKLAEQVKIESSPSYRIKNNLQSKINELNAELGLPKKIVEGDLPQTAATAVKLIDLSDKARGEVDFNGDLQFTSASTYKLFVAYAMIHAVETGRMSWSSSINGTTLEICLQRMIVNSDNVCPEAYLARVGFSTVDSQVHELGISDQTQIEVYDMRTSANDLALFLQKFYRGELMSAENQQKLIDLMKQQVYRQGIPAGVLSQIEAGAEGEGTFVADKVGFINALLSDAGIIYSNKGDYVLVIMTNGESWEFIAQLASWIDEEMAAEL